MGGGVVLIPLLTLLGPLIKSHRDQHRFGCCHLQRFGGQPMFGTISPISKSACSLRCSPIVGAIVGAGITVGISSRWLYLSGSSSFIVGNAFPQAEAMATCDRTRCSSRWLEPEGSYPDQVLGDGPLQGQECWPVAGH